MSTELKIVLKQADRLTDHDIQTWRALQESDPTLDSPFYSPDFTQALQAIGKTVTVALISTPQNDIVGIWPFHHGKGGIASPVGGPICDYQGIIGPVKDSVKPLWLLKACHLKAYDFNHLPLSQSALAEGHYYKDISPYINLQHGFERWRRERLIAGKKQFRNFERRQRKIERENGIITFRFNNPNDDRAWHKLLEWKRLSYKSLGVRSILDVDWVLEVLDHIKKTKTEHFSGILSTAYIGDELLAVNFGLRTKTVYHGWFSSYNQNYSSYSPGITMLLNCAKFAAQEGITKIDLGKGKEKYKQSFGSGVTMLCEGSIETSYSLSGLLRKARKTTHKSMSTFPSLNKLTDIQRRGFNRILKAGAMPDMS